MARINKVQVADPGVAFTLSFDVGDIPTGSRLTDISITATVQDNSVTGTPSFSVTTAFSNLANPITDTTLVIIMPFGDSTWASGHNMVVSVALHSVSVPNLNSLVIPSAGATSQSGEFDYTVAALPAASLKQSLKRFFGLK